MYGTFYRPPNSNVSLWDDIEYSIDLAYNTKIENIIITGDFNQGAKFVPEIVHNTVHTYCQYNQVHHTQIHYAVVPSLTSPEIITIFFAYGPKKATFKRTTKFDNVDVTAWGLNIRGVTEF